MIHEDKASLKVAWELARFVEEEALPGTGIEAGAFWDGFAAIVRDLAPANAELLAKREKLQAQIDEWHRARKGHSHDAAAYRTVLEEIGYLVPEGEDFAIGTENVDPEIAETPGPQLVVPITNARYALNAANARWGNLYDALYGTDAIGDPPAGGGYDAARGGRVIAWGKGFLDRAVPLAAGSWADVTRIEVTNGVLDLGESALADPSAYEGWVRDGETLRILLRNNGLGIVLVVSRSGAIGADDPAGLDAIHVEAALSAIMDCEDSVACVDAADKVGAYRNWLGLMRGDLTEEVSKGGTTFTRSLNPDMEFNGPDGAVFDVKGRALMLIRNVGHLMSNPAILQEDGSEIPEGLMDAAITALIAMHDLKKTDGPRNSVTGSVYVVKPKMHGPEEVRFACETFDRVEAMLGLSANTVKLWIMDEERRTSANLKACIRAAKDRVAF
ncbi:MAG: malate synthase G, partial [Pseudomonadota bacterium]